MSDELLEKVDKEAREMGISRSAFCTMSIGQCIRGMEKGVELVKDNLELFANLCAK